jgi:hypothetical protein
MPEIIRNGGELTEIEWTLLLEQSMSNISRMQKRMPVVSSGPLNDTRIDGNEPLVGRKWYRTH